jgi:aspartyl/asparaginyl beta-hydroxylase (cupin superfamily)
MIPLTTVDIDAVSKWISGVPFECWPQQHPVDHQLRPAMVNDLAWQDFGTRTDDLVKELLIEFPLHSVAYNRMLSVVMPGHSIPPHVDEQPLDWITRVHVPLITNNRTFMIIEGELHAMAVGTAYSFDTRRQHAVRNTGNTPRIHFMFDVRRE